MTRVLAELLNATEPLFSRSIRALEGLSGRPSADIRLTGDIQQAVRVKLKELRLDSADTTGPELYAALAERLSGDESRFRQAIMKGNYDGDLVGQVVRALAGHLGDGTVFALKASAARKILKANPPKRTMKLLGYRSADSMLRQESPAALIAGARLVESDGWQKRLASAYGKLTPNDFESRPLSVEYLQSQRWQSVAAQIVPKRREYVSAVREHGAVVLLPLHEARPRFAALLTAVLVVHGANEIRTASAGLKLEQLQPGFGKLVQQVAAGQELLLPASDLDGLVSWKNLHRYLAGQAGSAKARILEPVVTAEQLAWHSAEQVLAAVEPTLEFWHGTAHLGVIHRGRAVSMNLTDSLLSHVNGVPYEQQIVHHLQDSLRTELLFRYLKHDKLEQTVLATAQAKLAPELVMAD